MRQSVFSVVGAALAVAACASTAVVTAPGRGLVLAHDDSHASGALTFPSDTYESVVRFQLPDGEHKPLRLWFQAEAPGKLEINIYDSTPLETPGDPIQTMTRDLVKDDLSDGKDGRWVVEDLAGAKPVKGIVWVGVHRLNGMPGIWTSNVVSGQAFVRDNDRVNPMGLLPSKRTPIIRLELLP
jgi:hypothetical protein